MTTQQTLDQQLEALTQMCRDAMRNRIVECLRTHGRPMTSQDIAAALGTNHQGVQRAVCDLVVRRQIAGELQAGGKPRYWAVAIGACEWCGLVDHHLVAGECPRCRKPVFQYDPHRVIEQAATARQEEQADVIHHA